MNILTTILQASAPAGASAPQGGIGGGGMMWILLIGMFVIMWLFMIRPQRKQQKELVKFRNERKKGDKVVTVGGIYGVVEDMIDRSVRTKVDGEVKLRVDKNSLVRDYTQDAAQQQ